MLIGEINNGKKSSLLRRLGCIVLSFLGKLCWSTTEWFDDSEAYMPVIPEIIDKAQPCSSGQR